MFTNTKSKTVHFPVGQYIANLEIPTIDDDLIEIDGKITARIRPSDAYEVAESPYDQAAVVVYDNDQSRSGIMVLPQSNIVVEGQPAKFFIKSSQTFAEDQTISVAIETSGDFIDEISLNLVTLPQNTRSITYEVPTIDDNSFESTGSVRVTIRSTN